MVAAMVVTMVAAMVAAIGMMMAMTERSDNDSGVMARMMTRIRKHRARVNLPYP